MKKLALTVLLALLVVLTAVSLRRSVLANAATTGAPAMMAIGGDPVPLPPAKPSSPKPSNARWSLAIGGDPVPLPPPKPSSLKPTNGPWLVAIGGDPVPLPPPKPKN